MSTDAGATVASDSGRDGACVPGSAYFVLLRLARRSSRAVMMRPEKHDRQSRMRRSTAPSRRSQEPLRTHCPTVNVLFLPLGRTNDRVCHSNTPRQSWQGAFSLMPRTYSALVIVIRYHPSCRSSRGRQALGFASAVLLSFSDSPFSTDLCGKVYVAYRFVLASCGPPLGWTIFKPSPSDLTKCQHLPSTPLHSLLYTDRATGSPTRVAATGGKLICSSEPGQGTLKGSSDSTERMDCEYDC